MTRKIRSLQRVPPIQTQVDIVSLYEELAPPWRLGLAAPPPVEWDRAIFGDRKRSHGATVQGPKQGLKHAA
jgi:hypothetical protein